MVENTLPSAVNKHYLEKVMALSEEADVASTEDIYNTSGMKLIAKGAKISRAVQEKLILHKLQKPLESCIAVDGGVDVNAVLREARRIAETAPISSVMLLSEGSGRSPFEIIGEIKLGNAMKMMLTISERGGPKAISHSVMVSLVSICLAKKMCMSEQDQTSLALAGLLHDIGELYIDPIYLDPAHRLLPHEWRHVVVHPRVGQMLIGELESYPAGVSRAVSEHHERIDGTGYPRQISGTEISMSGQILSAAEMISRALIEKDRPLQRAVLAMKIIPQEHGNNVVSMFASVLELAQSDTLPINTAAQQDSRARVLSLRDCIAAVLAAGKALNGATTLHSQPARALLSQILERVRVVERAFSSTGLDVNLEDENDPGLLFEAEAASKEIQWRLRDLARHLCMRSENFNADEKKSLGSLVTLLDQ